MAFAKRSGTHPKYRTRQHREFRARLLAQLKADGYLTCTATVCLFPTRYITNPNGRAMDGLHAGHHPDGVTYRGPEHAQCNREDGAKRAQQRRRTKRTPTQAPSSPLRW